MSTLAEVQARCLRINPHCVDVIRDEIRLSRQLRNPEAMVNIGGRELEECRFRCRITAHGYVEFVGGDDTVLRVPEFPPKLMADP